MLKQVLVKHSIQKILAHSISINGKRISKGKVINEEDVLLFENNGIKEVYIFEIKSNYVEENKASLKIAKYISNKNIKIAKPVNGRADLYSNINGMLTYYNKEITLLNYSYDDLAIAMLQPYQVVKRNQLIGNIKIVPYAIEDKYLIRILNEDIFFNIINVKKPCAKKIILIISSDEENKKSNSKIVNSINIRLSKFNLKLNSIIYVKHSVKSIENSLKLKEVNKSDLILLYGSTSIVDKNDVIPQGLKKAKGKVIVYGAPTDPGNLLMYGLLQNKKVIGVPGCAKSVVRNGFDLILEKACFDCKIDKKIIAQMSCGGLFKNLIKSKFK